MQKLQPRKDIVITNTNKVGTVVILEVEDYVNPILGGLFGVLYLEERG